MNFEIPSKKNRIQMNCIRVHYMPKMFSLLLLTIVFVAVVFSQYAMNIHLDPAKASHGESVTVVCHITNMHNDSVTMTWVRRLDEEEIEIARNVHVNDARQDRLNEDFRRTRRYEIESQIERNYKNYVEYKFTLKIHDVQASDSGEIGCQLPTNNIKIFRTLVVEVPIKSIRLSSKDIDNTHAATYFTGQEVWFDYGDIHQFWCSTSGGYPEPRLRIWMDDDEITHWFQRTSELIKEGPIKTDGVQLVTGLYYSVQLFNARLNTSHGFNSKQLKCVADVPHSNLRSNSTNIKILFIDFHPKFECPSVMFAKLHQQNIELRCKVIGEPEVIKGRFQWKRISSGNISIATGETDGTITGILARHASDASAKEMILKISHVFPQHFRTYYFEATNRHGILSPVPFGIKLQQIPERIPANSGTTTNHLQRKLSQEFLRILEIISLGIILTKKLCESFP